MAKVVALCGCALLLTACGFARMRTPVIPGVGAIYTEYKAPLQINIDETRLGSKHATGEVTYVWLPLYPGLDVAFGDIAIGKVARDGGIQEIRNADYELLSVLGIFMRYKIHVYGD